MDREEALELLPPAHAAALRLRAGGAGHPKIADQLGVPLEGVGPLLSIAEAKLARLLQRGSEGE